MNPIGQHIVLRLEDDRVIAPSPSSRRLLARVVLEEARDYGLLAFRGADTHLHLETVSDRSRAGRLAWRIQVALGWRLSLDVSFAPAHYKAVTDQRHLGNAFFYILGQEGHHGCRLDPFHDASILPDLLGLRVVGGFAARNVQAFLPRVRRQHLEPFIGKSRLERPVVTYEPLAEAAAAALALPNLGGRSPLVVRARRAATQAVARELDANQVADLLGIGRRTVRRLRSDPSDARLVRAVQLQLRLRQPADVENVQTWATSGGNT